MDLELAVFLSLLGMISSIIPFLQKYISFKRHKTIIRLVLESGEFKLSGLSPEESSRLVKEIARISDGQEDVAENQGKRQNVAE